jgi:hypothetical protein
VQLNATLQQTTPFASYTVPPADHLLCHTPCSVL